MQTGSLINHLYSRATDGEPMPEVGMSATVLCWTDRQAATITEVAHHGTIVWLRLDHARRLDTNGMSESQVYEHSPNPEGALYCFRKSRYGARRWEEVRLNSLTGRLILARSGKGLRIGERSHYHDFSF